MADGHVILGFVLESSFCAHESLQKDSDTRQLTNNTKYNNCDPNRNLNLSWTGDFSSFKQFIEANVNIRGVWRSPGDERKTYSDGNTTITWWENKKKMQVSGKDSNSSLLKKSSVTFCWEMCLSKSTRRTTMTKDGT